MRSNNRLALIAAAIVLPQLKMALITDKQRQNVGIELFAAKKNTCHGDWHNNRCTSCESVSTADDFNCTSLESLILSLTKMFIYTLITRRCRTEHGSAFQVLRAWTPVRHGWSNVLHRLTRIRTALNCYCMRMWHFVQLFNVVGCKYCKEVICTL